MASDDARVPDARVTMLLEAVEVLKQPPYLAELLVRALTNGAYAWNVINQARELQKAIERADAEVAPF
jgi:hypothetical protein